MENFNVAILIITKDSEKINIIVFFVCVDALRPSQLLFCLVGMICCLPGLNQY